MDNGANRSFPHSSLKFVDNNRSQSVSQLQNYGILKEDRSDDTARFSKYN